MPGFLRHEPTIDELESATEKTDAEVSLEEKKVLLAKLKHMYGDKPQGMFRGIKSGIDWNSVKFKVK